MTGKQFRLSSKFFLVFILSMFFFLDVFVLWFVIRSDRANTYRQAQIRLEKAALSLEERIKRTVIATEAILRNRAERIREQGLTATVSSRQEWERLRETARGLPDEGSLWLLNDKADLLMDSTVFPSQRMNFSERAYYITHRDQGIETYIGPVVKGRITGKYSFTISRRITGKDGVFLGIIVAAIDTDDFNNFLRHADLGEGSTVTVFRTDGTMILRQPMEDKYLGQDFKHLKLFTANLHTSPSGIYETDVIDGTRRLVAYRSVQGLPLVVVTGTPVDSVLQGWRARVRIYSLVAVCIFCALVGLSWIIHKTTSREEKEKADELYTANELLREEIKERETREGQIRHLASFPELNPNPVIETDTSGRVIYCNPAAQKALENLGLDKGDCTHFLPTGFDDMLKNWQRKGRSVFSYETTVKESIFDVLCTFTPEFKTVRFYATDITQRRHAEDALRRSREDLDRAQEVGQIGWWRMDTRQNILSWSDENYRIFGVPKGTPLSYESFLDTIHPDDRLYVDERWKAGLRGEPYDIEHRIIAEGRVKWVREKAYLEFSDEGELLGGFGITQDITERKQAEEEQRKSVDRLNIISATASQLLASNNPQKIVKDLCCSVMEHLDCHAFFNFLIDDERNCLRLNAYAGIPEETAREIRFLDFGVAVCGCAARDACRIVAENIPTTPDIRTDLVRSFGIKAYACHPLFAQGKVIGTLSFGTKTKLTFSDDELSLMKTVADQVATAMERVRLLRAAEVRSEELERRVQERASELQTAYKKLIEETAEREMLEDQLRQSQKMEAIGTLAGGIAHDFNNILAGIIGFTEMALEDIPDNDPTHRRLELVLKGAIRGRDLVKQILTFSRKAEYKRESISVSEVLAETIKLLRASLPSTIQIIPVMTAASDIIIANPTEIQQVIMNLSTNAAHAMQERGGTLSINLDEETLTEETAAQQGLVPGDYLVLIVKDTGSGIEPNIIDHIFEPFFTTKEVGKGTGMGLAIVYGIVKGLGGDVSVKSVPGTGTTFKVLLPKSPPEAALGTRSAVLTTEEGGGERILFIDDEEFLVELGQTILERFGYDVTTMTDSAEALSLIERDPSRFDLVITDQTMPGMTGIELAGKILEIRADMPVILCTGYSESTSREEVLKRGIRGFLMKPLQRQELVREIRSVFDTGKAKQT